MTDYISRQAAIDKIEHDPIGKLIIDKYNVRGWLEGLPAADVVEVVRCKDCEHWHEWENGTGSCDRSGSVFWTGTDADDFCSYGERADK